MTNATHYAPVNVTDCEDCHQLRETFRWVLSGIARAKIAEHDWGTPGAATILEEWLQAGLEARRALDLHKLAHLATLS